MLLIGTDGRVKRTRLLKSSGHADLDEATRTGIAQCIFTVGTVDGVPTEAWQALEYVWTPTPEQAADTAPGRVSP